MPSTLPEIALPPFTPEANFAFGWPAKPLGAWYGDTLAHNAKLNAGPSSAVRPNPSIEGDVQELSLLAAPHVKR